MIWDPSDANPLHRRLPAEVVSRREKRPEKKGPTEKKVQEPEDVVVDQKTAVTLKPDARPKWLTKACRMTEDGKASATELYNIVVSRRFSAGLPERIGRKLGVIVQKNLSFSAFVLNTILQTVPGSGTRECAKRLHLMNTCSEENVVCKCPVYAKLAGDDPACDPDKYYDGRKFDPAKVDGKGCACFTPAWVPRDRIVNTAKCPVESYFKNIRPELDDFAATAHEWCNSKIVPEDHRVPKSLRGVYWMRGSYEYEVAFCTTGADYDKETLTAKLSPMFDFVYRKSDNETIPWAVKHDGLRKEGKRNSYFTLKFQNESMTYANITVEGGLSLVMKMPLMEVQETADGLISSKRKGDIFARPSFVFGAPFAKYDAVRIVDDEGTVNAEWYKMMEEAEHRVKTSFVRFEQDCASNKEEMRDPVLEHISKD